MSRPPTSDPGDGSTLPITPAAHARHWADRIDSWWIFTPLARRLCRIRRRCTR